MQESFSSVFELCSALNKKAAQQASEEALIRARKLDALQKIQVAACSSPGVIPSGPRRQGEGCDDEEQGIIEATETSNGGAKLLVTLLAAGFLIGPGGASIRSVSQKTGAEIRSWSQTCTVQGKFRRVRIIVVEGAHESIILAVSILNKAVERYKLLCEGKFCGKAVEKSQFIQGVEFFYSPPPRSAVPFAAALKVDYPSSPLGRSAITSPKAAIQKENLHALPAMIHKENLAASAKKSMQPPPPPFPPMAPQVVNSSSSPAPTISPPFLYVPDIPEPQPRVLASSNIINQVDQMCGGNSDENALYTSSTRAQHASAGGNQENPAPRNSHASTPFPAGNQYLSFPMLSAFVKFPPPPPIDESYFHLQSYPAAACDTHAMLPFDYFSNTKQQQQQHGPYESRAFSASASQHYHTSLDGDDNDDASPLHHPGIDMYMHFPSPTTTIGDSCPQQQLQHDAMQGITNPLSASSSIASNGAATPIPYMPSVLSSFHRPAPGTNIDSGFYRDYGEYSLFGTDGNTFGPRIVYNSVTSHPTTNTRGNHESIAMHQGPPSSIAAAHYTYRNEDGHHTDEAEGSGLHQHGNVYPNRNRPFPSHPCHKNTPGMMVYGMPLPFVPPPSMLSADAAPYIHVEESSSSSYDDGTVLHGGMRGTAVAATVNGRSVTSMPGYDLYEENHDGWYESPLSLFGILDINDHYNDDGKVDVGGLESETTNESGGGAVAVDSVDE